MATGKINLVLALVITVYELQVSRGSLLLA
jgi:hypothetical protein